MSTWKKFIEKKQIDEGFGDTIKSGINMIRGKRSDGVDAKLASGHETPKIWGSIQVDTFNKTYNEYLKAGFSAEEAASHATKEVETEIQTKNKMNHWNIAANKEPNPDLETRFGLSQLMGRGQRPQGIRDAGGPRPLPVKKIP